MGTESKKSQTQKRNTNTVAVRIRRCCYNLNVHIQKD